MSDKPKFEGRKIENASSQQLREELENYVKNVLSYDPDTLKFALMVTGHDESNGNTRVYSMIGGPPQALATAVVELMDALIQYNPIFTTFFLLNAMQRMYGSKAIDMSKLDDIGGPDVGNQVKEILAKIMRNTN